MTMQRYHVEIFNETKTNIFFRCFKSLTNINEVRVQTIDEKKIYSKILDPREF